jgi:small subunit ribosomal protein S1
MDQMMEDFTESIDMEHVADSALDDIRPGVVIQGEIVTVDNDYAYVNVGTKSDGRIPLDEFDEAPEVGKIVRVMLQSRRLVDGVYQFSVRAALEEKGWQQFLEISAKGTELISGRIVAATNKGKIVDCNGFRAFLPFSLSADLKGESATADEYEFKIKSIDRKKRSIVISRKDYIDEMNREKWKAFLSRYKAGDMVEGEVVKFVEFGAFVRVDGIDALLHRNDMSWKNVFKQRKLLKLNEKRQFVILAINAEEGKISLGMKQLAEDPWLSIENRLAPGTIVEGTIVTVVNTGAFVEIDDEVEGFLSNNELSWTQNNQSV